MRLLGDKSTELADVDVEGAWRQRVLQLLSRDELKGLVDRFELQSVDRRNAAAMAQVLSEASVDLADMLEDLSRTRMKELCRILGLDDSGRERAPLLGRLANKGGDLGPPEQKAYAPELTVALLAEILGSQFTVVESRSLWPARVSFQAGSEAFDFDLYIRRVGPSRNAQERRLQNPTMNQAISPTPDTPALLLGVWLEQGLERAAFVAFDAYRRTGNTTRFSLFTPLSLLESAVDSGYSTHVSTSGERIIAFKPANFGRYLDEVNDEILKQPPQVADEKRPTTMPPRRASSMTLAKVDHDRVEIRPKAGMFSAFARLNYKPWFALAELVDNAVQSFLAHHTRLEAVGHTGPLLVDIRLDEGELSILDRAAGIPFSEFGRAFSPAAPPSDTSGLSEFGLGMKAAASWFAREWYVRTKALGDPNERTVRFDVAEITKNGLDHLPIDRRPAGVNEHYTEVTMKKLRNQPKANTVAKMKEHLASIYRLLIKDGTLELRFTSASGQSEVLRHEEPPLLTAAPWNAPNASPILWRKELNIELGDKRITGWAGLLENGKYSHAGFAVFRRQRLIEGSVGEAYRPHVIFKAPNSFISQRLIGELYVDGFEVTHTKDGIQWGSEEDDLLHKVYEQLDSDELPLIRQAMNYRARNLASKLIPSFGGEALEAVSDVLSSVEMSEAMARTPKELDPYAHLAEDATPESRTMQSRRFRMQIQADKILTICVRTVRDPGARWLDVRIETDDKGANTLQIAMNLDHPFSEEHINGEEKALEPVMHLAACLGVAEHQARLQGVKYPASIRTHLNEMLRGGLGYLPPGEENA